MESHLVRIPRHLLHAELDDLASLGASVSAHNALRALLADLPMVPDATLSAQLVGPPHVATACLAVLARHVGQGLRDHNLSLAHDRVRLHAERQKLIFLSAPALSAALDAGDARALHEAVVFVLDATPALQKLFETRAASGLATYIAVTAPLPNLPHWRHLDLSERTDQP